jgi:hypothetical protein
VAIVVAFVLGTGAVLGFGAALGALLAGDPKGGLFWTAYGIGLALVARWTWKRRPPVP